MDIKHKLYPHPVLNNETDDYKSSSFSCEVTQLKRPNEFFLTATFELNNPELEKMIQANEAEFVLHVECPRSSLRRIYQSSDPVVTFTLEDNKLIDKVSICPFLLAKKDLTGFTNTDFNDDYNQTSFSCDKGAILAVGSQVTFSVSKEKNDLATTPSIFKIYHKLNHKDHFAVVELEDNDIKIGLNREDFLQYQAQCRKHTNVVNSFLIFPALIYALEYIRKDLAESEDLKWVQALTHAMKNNGLTLNQELLDSKPSMELAQILMQSPITAAFTQINDHFTNWEDDES